MPLSITRHKISATRMRITKKRQFRDALYALEQLSRGSVLLPDDICVRLSEAAKDMALVRDRWIFKHRAAIIIPLWQQMELRFTEERTEP